MDTLNGRIAVVTGAASGIGFAAAQAFVAGGARVMLADINSELLDEAVATLRAGGADVHGRVTDVTDAEAVEALAAHTVDCFGGLHIAVNNAGIVNRGLSWELSVADWQRVLNLNLWGVIHGVRAFVPRILATGEAGHVVNVASMAAVNSLSRLGPYVASKHGVLGISDVLRLEFAELGVPVGVSVVMPGRIKTRMNPIGHVPAEQVAANIVDAIARNRFFVFTDHDSTDEVAARSAALVDARNDVVTTE